MGKHRKKLKKIKKIHIALNIKTLQLFKIIIHVFLTYFFILNV